jgi:hypothetical protein
MKTKLPHIAENDPMSDIVRKRDSEQKRKMKVHADSARYVKPSDLQVGDPVLVKTPNNLVKGGLPYKPTPLTITRRKVACYRLQTETELSPGTLHSSKGSSAT